MLKTLKGGSSGAKLFEGEIFSIIQVFFKEKTFSKFSLSQ
jgi:hypothetical protein